MTAADSQGQSLEDQVQAAWQEYQTADSSRQAASREVNRLLAAAAAGGCSRYRLSQLTGLTWQAVTARISRAAEGKQ